MKQTIKLILAFAAALLCGGVWATTYDAATSDNAMTIDSDIVVGESDDNLVFTRGSLIAGTTGNLAAIYDTTEGTGTKIFGTDFTLSDIVYLTAKSGGLSVNNPPRGTETIGYLFERTAETALVQFQIIDGTYVKCATYRLYQRADGIYAKKVGTAYGTSAVVGTFITANEQIGSNIPDGDGNYGYRAYDVNAVLADYKVNGALTVDPSKTMEVNGRVEVKVTDAAALACQITGNGELVLVGGGTLTLTGTIAPTVRVVADNGTVKVPNTFNGYIIVNENGIYDVNAQNSANNYPNIKVVMNGGTLKNGGATGVSWGDVSLWQMTFLADSTVDVGANAIFAIASEKNKFAYNLNGKKLTKTGTGEYILRTANFVGGGVIHATQGKVKLYDAHVDAATDELKLVTEAGATILLGSADSKGGPSFTGAVDIENAGTIERENYSNSVAVRNVKNSGSMVNAFTVSGLYERIGSATVSGALTVTPTTTYKFESANPTLTLTAGTLSLSSEFDGATTVNNIRAYVGDAAKIVSLTYDTSAKTVSYTVVREAGDVYWALTSCEWAANTEGEFCYFDSNEEKQTTKLLSGDTIVIAPTKVGVAASGNKYYLGPGFGGHRVRVDEDVSFCYFDQKHNIPASADVEISNGKTVTITGGYTTAAKSVIKDGVVIHGKGTILISHTTHIDGNVIITSKLSNPSNAIKIEDGGSLKVLEGTNVGTIQSNVTGKYVLRTTANGYTTYALGDAEAVANIAGTDYTSLADALAAAATEGQTVTLLKGVDGDLSVPEEVTVDAGSYEISGKIIIAANAQVTISGTQTTHGVSGSGKLVKNGTGEVKVGKDSSGNSISGVTVEVNGGALWLGHSDRSVGEGASLQNCTFVLNGGTLKGHGWPNVNGVTFDCRQDSSLTGSNDGYSIRGGSFTKTGSGTLALNIHLRGALTIAIEEGSFTVPSNRSIESSVKFSSVVLGPSDTVTAPNAVVISDTVSGSGTFNADLTLNAGSTIDATSDTVRLAAGKSLTFPEGDLNLVGVGNGDTVIRNVTSTPNGLSTAIVKIGGEAVGHLEYDAANHKVIYSTNTVVEVTPNITGGANLDSNGNFIWTSGAIWKKGDDVVELPEGARIVFDAATVHGVIIANQISAGEIYVTNSDTANHPFVFHNHTKEVDGTHEIDDKIDCLTATLINVETFNGELGLRVPIKGDIMFGPSTTLKFIAGADKNKPSKAYAYSITGRVAPIQVALDTDAKAGWFVIPESMYTTCQFAPQNAGVTLVYNVDEGEMTATSPISNGVGSILKTGSGTLSLTSNIAASTTLTVEEGTLKLTTPNGYSMKGHLVVSADATLVNMTTDAFGYGTDGTRADIYGTLDMGSTRWTIGSGDQSNEIYFYPGSKVQGAGESTYGAFDNGSVGKTHLHFVKKDGQGGTVTFNTGIRFRAANGQDVGMQIEKGMTVNYIYAGGFHTNSGTLNLTGDGIFNITAGAVLTNLSKIKLGLGMTLNVAAGKTVTVEPINTATLSVKGTTNGDNSKTYTVLKKLVPGSDVSQDEEPTTEELAKYTPVPVNEEAATAGQAELLKVVAEQTDAGWIIKSVIDEDKQVTINEETKTIKASMDVTAVAFAQGGGLEAVAGATETTNVEIPAAKVVSGLYYSVSYGTTPDNHTVESDRVLATGSNLTIAVPALGNEKVYFIKIKASAEPTANEQ